VEENLRLGSLSRGRGTGVRWERERIFEYFPQIRTKLATRADQLSGGEQQRVAIARTLMQSPAVILADEPVSSLDPRLSRVVLDILKRVCREDGITALVSLHTLDLTREYADRVVGLKHGQVFFDGAPKDLNDAIVEKVYQDVKANA
jgi:phosphonate transport system ATP-binding protein